MSAFFSNLFTLFLSEIAKNAVFAWCCEISIAEGRLHFNLVQKSHSAISTEAKSLWRELRCASQNKKNSIAHFAPRFYWLKRTLHFWYNVNCALLWQLHQTPRHNTINVDCLREIMLKLTWNHFENRNKRFFWSHAARGPDAVQACCSPILWFNLVGCRNLYYSYFKLVYGRLWSNFISQVPWPTKRWRLHMSPNSKKIRKASFAC